MDDQPIFVHTPALVCLLLSAEKTKGSALTREEVENITDAGICMACTPAMIAKMVEGRGYEDINPRYAWEQWKEARLDLNPPSTSADILPDFTSAKK